MRARLGQTRRLANEPDGLEAGALLDPSATPRQPAAWNETPAEPGGCAAARQAMGPGAPSPRQPAAWNETQRRLVEYYRLSRIPSVAEFLRPARGADRERLWVRQVHGQVELAVELPTSALALPASALEEQAEGELDRLCQVVEGVSHFVLLADRAARDRPTTELELELQAELDKYVLLAVALRRPLARRERSAVRARLFHQPRFLHPRGTIQGDRYRLAHRLAWRLTRRLERRYLHEARLGELRAVLRRIYRAGQSEKLAFAHDG